MYSLFMENKKKDEALNKKFIEFAARNDLISLQETLSKDPEINTEDKEGFNALHFAALNKNYEMCLLLLKSGININHANKMGQTPLHLAVSVRCESITSILIINNANVHAKNNLIQTPLGLALKLEDIDFLKFLTKFYPKELISPQIITIKNRRVLLNKKCKEICLSIWSVNSFLPDFIANYYSSLNCSDSRQFFMGKLKGIYQKITDNDSIKNASDIHKFAYFFIGCFEYKINPNNPLDNFLWFDKNNQLYPSLLSLILRCAKEPEFHTANPFLLDLGYQNLSLFMLFMRNFSFWGGFLPECESLFLEKLSEITEVDFNEQNNSWGNTYLHFMVSNACSGDCIRFLKTFLAINKGGHLDVNLLSKGYGTAPLHIAVAKGYRENDSIGRQVVNFLNLVETLVEAKANVNLKTVNHLSHQINGGLKLALLNSSSEQTSLHIACARRDLEMMRLLMTYGADPTIKNAQGLTALDVFHLSYDQRKEIVDSITGKGLNNFVNYEKEHSNSEHLSLCQQTLGNAPKVCLDNI